MGEIITNLQILTLWKLIGQENYYDYIRMESY